MTFQRDMRLILIFVFSLIFSQIHAEGSKDPSTDSYFQDKQFWDKDSIWRLPMKIDTSQKCTLPINFWSHYKPYSSNAPLLEVVRHMPYNAETPQAALVTAITPTPNVYVRANFDVPALSDDHSIEVGGAVLRPLTIKIDDLRKMPQKTVTATMECAGNGRVGMVPLPQGEPWKYGAVSTITWTGVPLAVVLKMAGIDNDAIEVLVTGADAGPREDAEGIVRFARALPIKEALRDDVLLALSMNGKPLTPDHGFPLRLVVPGWYGMASVKWITRIDLITKPYDGYFQTKRYVYEHKKEVTPVDQMLVNSFITVPADGAQTSRKIKVSGWAWSGHGAITNVEVSIEGGKGWHEAEIAKSDSPYAWTPWSIDLTVPYPGRFVVRSRATDASGATQPNRIEWNRLGYGNNAIRHILIDAE